ncbi:hypothetical protein [Sphaerisporangium aureirubrum]|uniref:Uncharacterized protein n=1 Tax=Sphaerisporangium aureirubrum TaxID=1544736 RepID=A0ABW1NNR6_9ACTN
MAFLSVPPAGALALPTPKNFTSYLDLECFKTNAYQPPTTNITVRHLNPVLANLPTETVTLGVREQLCLPVAKNNVIPPSPALDFIRYVDLACYRITGITVNQGLVLRHLNPLLQNLPQTQVVMNVPQQLCVPVIKNNVVPPSDVLALVSHIDLKCYSITPNNPLGQQLSLRQLNPLLSTYPIHAVQVLYARQLCVPVQKAGDNIPTEALNIIKWVDLEKFDAVPASSGSLPTITLVLRHINPVLAGLPAEQAVLSAPLQLGLPVAKNGLLPPG